MKKACILSILLVSTFISYGISISYKNLTRDKHLLKKIDEIYFFLRFLPRELKHSIGHIETDINKLLDDYDNAKAKGNKQHSSLVFECQQKIAELDDNLAKMKKSLLRMEYLVNSGSSWVDLNFFERTVFSQNGEDGILELIFEAIETTNKYYVEFGVEDGSERNTRNLQEMYGWSGLLMDGGYENEQINLNKEFITAENINQLFEKYNVPEEFDLLSIDIDYNDFHVWKALEEKYKPRVVIIEFNGLFSESDDLVVKYDPKAAWDKTIYCGASIKAMYNLGISKGYSLVYVENNGVNLFFIRDDVLDFVEKNMRIKFKDVNNIEKLYKPPFYDKKADPKNREFVSSESLLMQKRP